MIEKHIRTLLDILEDKASTSAKQLNESQHLNMAEDEPKDNQPDSNEKTMLVSQLWVAMSKYQPKAKEIGLEFVWKNLIEQKTPQAIRDTMKILDFLVDNGIGPYDRYKRLGNALVEPLNGLYMLEKTGNIKQFKMSVKRTNSIFTPSPWKDPNPPRFY